MRQSRNKLNVLNLLRHCRKDEISFDTVAKTGDIVAKNGDIVAETGDIVAKYTMLPASATLSLVWMGLSATMSPFLATLSLVWTGLNSSPGHNPRRS